MTSELFPSEIPGNGGSISSAGDSPARTFPLPESGPGSTAHTPDSGRSMRGSFAYFDRDTCLWRTFQACFLPGLDEFSATWPRSGTMQSGQLYQRARWVHHIHVKECSWWPTPTRAMGKHGFSFSKSGKLRMNAEVIARCHAIGRKPSPEFQEWLMGFPPGWTDLEPSAMPSFPRLPSGSEDD